MIFFIIKKTIALLVSVFSVITITFILFQFVPGNIYSLDRMQNETYVTNVKNKYGLDKPVIERYFLTLSNFIKLDFGYSYINEGRFVNDIIKDGFKISAVIGLLTILISIINGIFLGIELSFVENKKTNSFLIYILLIILISIPNFVIGILLQYLLCVKLNIFTITWSGTINSLILPVVVLSIYPTIFIGRLVNSNIEKVKNEDYILAAKARGISENKIFYRHILKNCLTPVVSYLGPLVANLIVGSFVVESLFNIPGLGRYFITSVSNRDYPLVMGLTVFYSFLLIIMNYMSDIINNILDPRINKMN